MGRFQTDEGKVLTTGCVAPRAGRIGTERGAYPARPTPQKNAGGQAQKSAEKEGFQLTVNVEGTNRRKGCVAGTGAAPEATACEKTGARVSGQAEQIVRRESQEKRRTCRPGDRSELKDHLKVRKGILATA